MKTQNNKLAFNKSAVTELNDSQLVNIEGGYTTVPCLQVSYAIAGAMWGYIIATNQN